MHVTVDFKCGHTETVRLYGNPMEVMAQRVAMEKKCECMDCALRNFGGVKTYEYDRLMEIQRDLALPSLEGSPKQVAWAMHLRQQMVALPYGGICHLMGLELHVLGSLPDYKRVISKTVMTGNEMHDKLYSAWRDMIWKKTDSTWWIANRFNFGYGLCNAILREWFDKDVNVVKDERRSQLSKQDGEESQETSEPEHEREDSEPNIPERNMHSTDNPTQPPTEGMVPYVPPQELLEPMPETKPTRKSKSKKTVKRRK